MRMLSTIVALAGLSLAFAAPVSAAMPMTSLDNQSSSLVQNVAGGCGIGWHRGPYGGCRRNYAPPVRACPRGFHLGPRGLCRPNW